MNFSGWVFQNNYISSLLFLLMDSNTSKYLLLDTSEIQISKGLQVSLNSSKLRVAKIYKPVLFLITSNRIRSFFLWYLVTTFTYENFPSTKPRLLKFWLNCVEQLVRNCLFQFLCYLSRCIQGRQGTRVKEVSRCKGILVLCSIQEIINYQISKNFKCYQT